MRPAGPAAVEALFSGAVDAVYIGPDPTVNAQVKSKGTARALTALPARASTPALNGEAPARIPVADGAHLAGPARRPGG